jgi:3-hydroxyacyl-[acyl-carrier-protein] dehydratase
MQPETAADGGWTVTLDPTWPGFAGHFPGDPILPGAEMLDWALELASTAGAPLSCVTKARFIAPARPGDVLRIELAGSQAGVRVRFRRGQQLIAEISLSR